jgi:hypothetical protein
MQSTASERYSFWSRAFAALVVLAIIGASVPRDHLNHLSRASDQRVEHSHAELDQMSAAPAVELACYECTLVDCASPAHCGGPSYALAHRASAESALPFALLSILVAGPPVILPPPQPPTPPPQGPIESLA